MRKELEKQKGKGSMVFWGLKSPPMATALLFRPSFPSVIRSQNAERSFFPLGALWGVLKNWNQGSRRFHEDHSGAETSADFKRGWDFKRVKKGHMNPDSSFKQVLLFL